MREFEVGSGSGARLPVSSDGYVADDFDGNGAAGEGVMLQSPRRATVREFEVGSGSGARLPVSSDGPSDYHILNVCKPSSTSALRSDSLVVLTEEKESDDYDHNSVPFRRLESDETRL